MGSRAEDDFGAERTRCRAKLKSFGRRNEFQARSGVEMKRLIVWRIPESLGDLVVLLPALELLCTAVDCELWITNPAAPQLVRFADSVHAIAANEFLSLYNELKKPSSHTFLARGGSTVGIAPIVIRAFGFDEIILGGLMRGLKPPLSLPQRPSIKFINTDPDLLAMSGAPTHAVDQLLVAAGRFIDNQGSNRLPRIRCDAGPRQNLAVIHPFSSTPPKNWPLDKFRCLAEKLGQRDLEVRWTHGPSDPPIDGAVCFENLYDWASWVSRAQIFIGNDSGPGHLAAAVGTPTIAVFTHASDPAVWAPRGEHVRVAQSYQSVDAIFKTAVKLLEQYPDGAQLDSTELDSHVVVA